VKGHILQFAPDGAAGGGTTVVLNLVEGLINEGWQVSVLTQAGSYCALKAAEIGANVRTAPFMGSRTDPSLTRAVNDADEAGTPDIIHLHGTRAAYFGRKLARPGVVCTIHGYHFLRKSFPQRVAGLMGARSSFGSIQDLIFVSDYDRRSGVEAKLIPPGARIHVIHNGVDLSPRAVERVEKQVAFPHRLTHPKDPITALGAMSLLAREGYSMVCAGSGELEDEVKARARELGLLSVTFRGGLSRDETLNLIASSGVMLMTSLWEGFPMTPLEAMALGTPVVAPAVCGIPEMIEDGDDGLLVQEHRPETYATAIRRLQDPELRKSIVEKARAKIAAKFTWERTLRKHLDIYEKLVAA
jgi:glycosyltransferase involved in cell wall biosynthesis